MDKHGYSHTAALYRPEAMESRFNIYSDLVISRHELEISPIHFLISLNIY